MRGAGAGAGPGPTHGPRSASVGGRATRVGLVVHAGRPAAVEAARSLVSWLRGQGLSVRCLAGEPDLGDEARDPESFPHGLDLVVSVGGDGTLLRAAHLASRSDAPVLGVNVGRLGFLTEVGPDEAPALLDRVLEGRARIEERLAVVARPRGAPWREPQWALNEVIVEKRARHRLVTLAARIGGEYVTTFSADGVIVATPTGSTAYSFSARGPIVSPRASCLVLTPVSPHMVFDRSIVLAPEEGVTLEVIGDEPGLLSADGRPGLELPVGSTVHIEASDRPARLVRREGTSFFTLLREKFQLPGEPRGLVPPDASGLEPPGGDDR
ncbi:MAG TPA: NAD(+)/NADH kinase [Actinomycetota bacterium]|nr:NAD(+)/NADH kinase [Actinomycetota bacterium]